MSEEKDVTVSVNRAGDLEERARKGKLMGKTWDKDGNIIRDTKWLVRYLAHQINKEKLLTERITIIKQKQIDIRAELKGRELSDEQINEQLSQLAQ